jgi:hypothetical protein
VRSAHRGGDKTMTDYNLTDADTPYVVEHG